MLTRCDAPAVLSCFGAIALAIVGGCGVGTSLDDGGPDAPRSPPPVDASTAHDADPPDAQGAMDTARTMDDSGAPDDAPTAEDAARVDARGSDGGGVDGSDAGVAMNTYLGTTHFHTGCCNNHGESNLATASQVFAAAKANPNRFDFLYLTEHSGGTGPASMGMAPAAFYAEVQRLAASFTDRTFVGVAGFEYSDNDGGGGLGGGHMTAANTADFVSADGPSNSATLEDYLVAQAASGRAAYGGFNHPDASGHPGAAASLVTPARRGVIAMNEVHNSYVSDADNTYFDSFIAALDHGWRVAPTCGLDGHGTFRAADTRPQPGPCRTGVLAPALTHADLDAAIMAGRIYSTRDIDLRVSYHANGFWMGSQIGHPSSVAFDVSVTDPDTTVATQAITRLEIVADGGAVVASQAFATHAATWRVSVPAGSHRYFLLRIFNGERTTYTAAAAPVWLE